MRSVAPEQPPNDHDHDKLEHNPYTLGDGVRPREAFQVEEVEDRMRHGIHRSRGDGDCAQQLLAGQRGCSEHHRQGKAQLADVTSQMLVVRRKQRDPRMSR